MKYRVFICETIGDIIQQEWHEDYDTANDAIRRIEYFRVHGKIGADWFATAKEEIEVIE